MEYEAMNHEQALKRIEALINPNTTPDGNIFSDEIGRAHV